MTLLEKTNKLIDQYEENIVCDLGTLVSFPSIAAEETDTPPFGGAVQDVFRFMLEKGEAEGFTPRDVDAMGGHIEWEGRSHEIMAMAVHLDVVPEGGEWVHEPFKMIEEDGRLYGRGTVDDKGPTIAAFYAMKALKEAGFEPNKTIRMIFGLNEETTWSGMEHYFECEDNADIGFIPDGEFPVIHGEMGILVFDLARKFGRSVDKGLRLRSIKGGSASNMVADSARAVVLDDDKEEYEKIKGLVAEQRKKYDCRINCKGIGKSFEITVQGTPAHGSTPEEGLNAVSVLMELLGMLNFSNEEMNDFISFYNNYIGFEFHGDSLGCGLSDKQSGKLILNVGMIELDTKAAGITINVRYPVTETAESVYQSMNAVLSRYNIGILKLEDKDPIYYPKDSELISSLMEVYRKYTGDEDAEPITMGGGTYARIVKNSVAFGPTFRGDKSICHQKDEYIERDKLILLTKIYAEAVYRLAGDASNA